MIQSKNDVTVCWEKDQRDETLRLLLNYEDADGYLPERRIGFLRFEELNRAMGWKMPAVWLENLSGPDDDTRRPA
jgi:hypothetical protein